MRLLTKILVFIATLLVLITSHADGNGLLKWCSAAEKYIETDEVHDEFYIGMCFGLVQGVRDSMKMMKDDKIKACFPKEHIDNGQAVLIVTSYLRNNPGLLQEDESLLIMLAYSTTYRCK
jgi:hypothetical protein